MGIVPSHLFIYKYMIKTYKANTNVSINVVLASKKNLRISFTPLSNGSSTFTTDNEEIMNAIERHYNFGKLFRLHCTQGESKKKTIKVVEFPTKEVEKKEEQSPINPASTTTTEETDNEDEGAADTDSDENDKPTLKQVTVSDLSSAKDYLADKFGISRTTLRSKKAIVEQAAANGIEFEGLS